jgi:hypothetical protein
MEITEKDFELIDNYLEGTLSREEQALFSIRMQDDEFTGFLRFQQNLKEEFSGQSRGIFYYREIPEKKKRFSFKKTNLKRWIWGLAFVVAGVFVLLRIFSG